LRFGGVNPLTLDTGGQLGTMVFHGRSTRGGGGEIRLCMNTVALVSRQAVVEGWAPTIDVAVGVSKSNRLARFSRCYCLASRMVEPNKKK